MTSEPTNHQSLSIRPETHPTFRLAQLLIVFLAMKPYHPEGVALERLAYYEFFSAHPFLMFSPNDPEWRDLVSVGRELATVAYASSHHRFITTRQRLRHDVAGLSARGLVGLANVDGRLLVSITEHGKNCASEIRALYARALEQSATLVISKLKRLSDSKLDDEARKWLRNHPVLLDL